jgi:hypothetical protein
MMKTSPENPESITTTMEKDIPTGKSGEESYDLLKDLPSQEITSDDSGTSNNTSDEQFILNQ